MHRLTVNTELIREVVAELMAVGFSPAQAKALIVTIKKIHDGLQLVGSEKEREQ